MKKDYNPFAILHWIATPCVLAMTEVEHMVVIARRSRGNPVQGGVGENTKAFSLIELLISLIIISLVAAAFVPVYTKKLAKNQMTVKVANAKKGLMIYTNPGTYAFDIPEGIDKIYLSGAGGGGGGAGANKTTKTKSFTTNSTFKIPAGVNAVTIKITGSGGGGGAANGFINKTYAPASTNDLITNLYNYQCLSDEFRATRGSSGEKDLCITKKDISLDDLNTPNLKTLSLGQQCTATTLDCCWKNVYEGSVRSACNNVAAITLATWFRRRTFSDWTHNTSYYRLMNSTELLRLKKYIDSWAYGFKNNSNYLNLCSHDDYSTSHVSAASKNVLSCPSTPNCIGAMGNWCYWGMVRGQGDNILWQHNMTVIQLGTWDGATAASVRLVRELDFINKFSGAGGASGAQLEKTFNVLPDDILEFTIGQGGLGGVYNINNGKGSQGGITKVVHKRNGNPIATYQVLGGLGGNGATNSAHGNITPNPTPANTCRSFPCSVLSFSGTQGTPTKGGDGGKVNNEGAISLAQASSGGCTFIDESRTANQRATGEEIRLAKGQAAATYGFGGGGGHTPNWAQEAGHFYQGGAGAQGKVDIAYTVVLPGGGGGAGASAGLGVNNIDYEIEYPVTAGSRTVFVIGSGGGGGNYAESGRSGADTTFMENQIIFKGGKGGLTGNPSYETAGIGGEGGSLVINKNGAKLLNYSLSSLPKGGSGESGQKKDASGKLLSYGFDGGVGGGTFLGYFGGCGGGMYSDNNSSRGCLTSAKEDGYAPLTHNAVNNTLGGTGGGGGGATSTTTTLGKGAAGADGFLRIRWGD